MGRLWIVFVVAGLALPAAAQEWPLHRRPDPRATWMAAVQNDGLTVLGRWAEGPCLAVAVQGTTAYFGNGGYLVVADVSDPAEPVERGRVLVPSTVADLAVAGEYVYVAAYGGGLRIVDVSDPGQPVVVGAFATPGVALGVAIQDSRVLVADFVSVYVLDVTDPAAPVQLSRLQNPTGTPVGVALVDDLAFVADYAGLRVYDLSTATAPHLLAATETPGFAVDLAVQGDYLYLAEPPAGLRIFDVSDPVQPAEVGFLRDAGLFGLAVRDTLVYGVSGNLLVLVDVTDPVQPASVGTLTLDGTATAVLPAEGLAYVAASEGGLEIVDVSDPARPEPLGGLPTGGEVYDVALQPGRVFLGEAGGLRVLDVADPARPVQTAFVEVRAVNGVVVDGTTAYLAAGGGLRIFDVADPAAPAELGAFSYGGIPRAVALAGNLAIIADEFRNLQLIDVSDPRQPTRVGFIQEPASSRDLAVAGDLAYVAHNGEGLCIADIAVPSQPMCISLFPQPSVQGVALDGTTAYLADGAEGLIAVDVVNPQLPGLSRRLPLPGFPVAVTLDGSLAYVAAMEAGLRLVDLQDFAEVGFLEAGRTARDAAVGGDRVYVAAGTSGLYIAQRTGGGTATEDASPLSEAVLRPPFPNPSAADTHLSLQLAQAAHVRLQVFDGLGRHLRTLVDAPLGPGGHLIDWDGRDAAGRPVAAGVYYCRMVAGGAVRTVPVWRLSR